MTLLAWQRTPLGPDSNLRELKALIERNDENLEATLQQIEDAVLGTYGGLSYDGPAVPLTATTTPTRVTAFDTVGPARGVGVDAVADTLTALSAGVYDLSAQVTADISSGAAYILELYSNGLATGIRAGVDASNQTSGVFLSLHGLRAAEPGAVVELRVSRASGSGPFNVVNAEFYASRVGL